MKRFLTVVDDFHSGPCAVRRRARNMPCFQPESLLGSVIGWRTRTLERDARTRSCWVEIDRVGNVINRAAMFAGGFLHSASRRFGSTLENGRIYQSFHFPVEAAHG